MTAKARLATTGLSAARRSDHSLTSVVQGPPDPGADSEEPVQSCNQVSRWPTLVGMSCRRWVGASVLLAWFFVPALGALSAATRDPHGDCSGHVCQCRRQSHCPPKRPAAGKSCHEAAAGSRPCEMSSRCNHESDPLPVASRSDWLPSPVEELGPDVASGPAQAPLAAHPDAGHTRLDPQPPRLAS
jgi:hypothetical protein